MFDVALTSFRWHFQDVRLIEKSIHKSSIGLLSINSSAINFDSTLYRRLLHDVGYPSAVANVKQNGFIKSQSDYIESGRPININAHTHSATPKLSSSSQPFVCLFPDFDFDWKLDDNPSSCTSPLRRSISRSDDDLKSGRHEKLLRFQSMCHRFAHHNGISVSGCRRVAK